MPVLWYICLPRGCWNWKAASLNKRYGKSKLTMKVHHVETGLIPQTRLPSKDWLPLLILVICPTLSLPSSTLLFYNLRSPPEFGLVVIWAPCATALSVWCSSLPAYVDLCFFSVVSNLSEEQSKEIEVMAKTHFFSAQITSRCRWQLGRVRQPETRFVWP